MAEELLLHVNKEDYLRKINELDGKLNQLRDLLSRYNTLKSNVNRFVQDRDSNFEQMQANVEANVDAVRRAIAITQKSRESLQKTVDQMEDMGSKTSAMLSEAANAAVNGVKTAIRIEGLL